MAHPERPLCCKLTQCYDPWSQNTSQRMAISQKSQKSYNSEKEIATGMLISQGTHFYTFFENFSPCLSCTWWKKGKSCDEWHKNTFTCLWQQFTPYSLYILSLSDWACLEESWKSLLTKVFIISGNLFKTRCTKCQDVQVNKDSPICPALAGKGWVLQTAKCLYL